MTQQPSKNDQVSLREAAQSDQKKNLKAQLTGWGKICKDRCEKGLRKRNKK